MLPLFWRHYTAAEYEAVQDLAIKKGRKAGMWFVAPFTVDCYASGPERDAFLASVPGVLRLFHRRGAPPLRPAPRDRVRFGRRTAGGQHAGMT